MDGINGKIVLTKMPPETAPKGAPVLVAGGIAMRKTGGKWYSGMTDEPFTRELNWEPKWWACIPQQNDESTTHPDAKAVPKEDQCKSC